MPSLDLVDRKVKALLNKLTRENFESISDQIITWANKSEEEKDGRTLLQVVRLTLEMAKDEVTSENCARLCRKLMEHISPKVQDEGIKNKEGAPVAGAQLFRKYLLNGCQEVFERGFVDVEATVGSVADTKIPGDEGTNLTNETQIGIARGPEVSVLHFDEHYAYQKARRQGLGFIKFIGELFKLQMLTERIMHECLKKLLGNPEGPEEDEMEGMCKLLTTVGEILDTPMAKAHMDVYFSKMKVLSTSHKLRPRIQFMLRDTMELRERKWVARDTIRIKNRISMFHGGFRSHRRDFRQYEAVLQVLLSGR